MDTFGKYEEICFVGFSFWQGQKDYVVIDNILVTDNVEVASQGRENSSILFSYTDEQRTNDYNNSILIIGIASGCAVLGRPFKSLFEIDNTKIGKLSCFIMEVEIHLFVRTI